MTRLTFNFIIIVFFISTCKLQSQEVIEKSGENINYIFANIYWDDIIVEELSTNHVTLIKQADPENTPADYFEGTGEVLVDLLISIVNTGEFSTSKLYSIEQLNNPEIIEIKEDIGNKRISIMINFRDKNGNRISKEFRFDSFM